MQANLGLMDVKQSAPAKLNNSIKYLLTRIDVLSKYAMVAPLKDKKVNQQRRFSVCTWKYKT